MLRTALVFTGMATVAIASSVYSIVAIPLPSGFTGVNMYGINDSGQVAGYGTNGGVNRAFLGSPLGSVAIALPIGWSSAVGFGVNSSGQVGGWGVNGSSVDQAFIGTTGSSTAIPLPTGWSSSLAYSVNDTGQVAGYGSNGSSVSQAFIVTTAGSTAIPIIAGWSSILGYGLNSSGQVAGCGFNGSTGDQAFLGTTGGTNAIFLPPGSAECSVAVNNSGQVTGLFNDAGTQRAFIGTTAGVTVIPLPLGASTASGTFQSVNNLAVVVGGSDAGGWIWDASDGTVLLNSLVVPAGWTVDNAISISNNGLILATASFMGGADQYVELSSVPEPGTFALAGVGLLVAAVMSRTVLGRR